MILWVTIALAAVALMVFAFRCRRKGWQWSWSKGARAPVVNGDTVTAPLQGECSMLLNYSPPVQGDTIRLEYRVTGGPFRYAEPEDAGKPVFLELILVRKGNDWTGGDVQQDFRQYHRVGLMEDTGGEWCVYDVRLSQPLWHNVWGRGRGLTTTLSALDAIGLRWRHGMVTDDPNARIRFRLARW